VSLAPAARAQERRAHAAKVTAFIPHRNGHRWLEQCLDSICRQSRRADRVVVADDASDVSPGAIVARFDGVTLLRSAEHVGPFRLLQEVVARTPDADAYLMQDADDWSAADRLELLLEAVEETGAEIVGCQELRVAEDDSVLLPVSYPLDANAALRERPGGYPVLHPSALVRRDLVLRLGGYATGLRFGGDSEFLRRAAHAARVSNVPWHSYFRRDHPASLTRSPATGFGSPAREEVSRGLQARAKMNAALVARRMKPDLMPWKTAPPIALEHVLGPPLHA
jgi:glycosyltransferase involved in cell wall biosynthesis